jgi:hypothetical protein
MDKKLAKFYISKLKECRGDTEIGHIDADWLLCDLLVQLGYSEVVEEFKKLTKWYA